MLKRLLIAVSVLSLLLAFTGTAFSDVTPKSGAELNPVVKVNPNNARFNQIVDARPAQPTFKKDLATATKLPGDITSVPAPPLDYFCEEVDYTSGSPAYYWAIPDAYGDDLFNMRFTAEANFDCTLKVAHFLMYGTAMVGAPDMRVYLWDDDGFGFPGTKLDSVDIPNADLPASGLGYVSADFSAANWVFSDGEEYHLGFTVLDNSGAGTDVIAVISDAADGPHAGEERASENWSGIWGTMLNDWGLDVSFFITSEVCCGEIPFTDCYTQGYAQNVAYVWRAPHPTWGDEAYSMRFFTEGPETLVSVDLPVYDMGNGSFGNDDVIISIYEDDGTGLPGALMTSQTVPAGTYPAFPSYTNVPFNYIIPDAQEFHIAFSSTGAPGVEYEATLSSDGTDGVGRSASDWGGGTWYTMFDGWGLDCNFLYYANMCRDEYALCETKSYYANLSYFWRLPDRYGDVANAMRISGTGDGCRVQEVSWLLYDNGEPDIYTTDSKISVYSDAGGLPGVELASIVITPADYVLYPGLLTVDFEPLEVYVNGDYHVAIEALTADTLLGIRTMSDDGSGGFGRSSELWGIYWGSMIDDWGGDYSFIAFSEHCCVPFGSRMCSPGTDPQWATIGGNQGRNGASQLGAGDAWCDLNLNWSYDGANSISFTGPAIYGDKAVCSFTDHYVVFDVATGATLYTLNNTAGDGNLLGASIRCTPTIVNMDVGGIPTDVMFVAGGTTNGVGAFDFNTGSLVWQRTIATEGPTGVFGQTRFCVMTVVNGVMYFTTDNSAVVAVDAETGALFGGWATNPVYLTGNPYISGATDGASLFYATQTAATEGDIYSIDAATGAINWQLSGSGGLQAQNIFDSYVYPEGFRGGVAYDDGKLHAVSYANDAGVSDHPTDGVYYTIDAATGALPVPAAATNRAMYSTPMVDINYVFAPTLTQWANPTDPTGGQLVAFNRNTGTQAWGLVNPDGDRYYTNGILTCEPDDVEEVDDLVFVFNEGGFLQCINYATGEEIFNRRVDHGGGAGNIGFSGAMAMSGGELYMMFGDFYGGLYNFTKGVDRPRLEIQTYRPTLPVEFGVDPALPVNAGPVIVNTGCADLTINAALVDEAPITGSTMPGFVAGYTTGEIMERAAKIADDLQREAFLSKFRQVNNSFDTEADLINVRDMDRERSTSRFSAGIPAWFVSLDHPTGGDIIAAGDTMNLEFTVNQPLISRGPQSVYIAFDSDDPDYFLNQAADAAGLLPEIVLTVVGGCLIDTTTLHFGVGAANVQLVTNTGRLGTGDWDPHGFEIDGDGASYYQGTMIYGNDTYRLAMHTQDWTSGGGEADAYVSLQPDPNYCDTECKAALTAGVSVGAITADGLTYDPITADMVCKTFLDSVENFDIDPDPLNTVWDWTAFGIKSFDDTLTMGLMTNSRVYGVQDLPELANLTFEIMEFTERNGNPVENWYIGHVADYDVGSDTCAIDQSISTAWAYNTPAMDAAWGSIKIPFGCGTVGAGQDFDYNPMRSIKGLTGNGALWDGNAYYDSAYMYLSLPNGAHASQNVSAGDFEMHMTMAAHSFAGGDTYSLGIAHFGVAGLADASSGAELADMANLVNKWAGFGRGDVNNDSAINLADIIYLAATVNNGGPGAIPFAHMADVNADGGVDAGDINYLVDYYFNCGPCPMGDWMF